MKYLFVALVRKGLSILYFNDFLLQDCNVFRNRFDLSNFYKEECQLIQEGGLLNKISIATKILLPQNLTKKLKIVTYMRSWGGTHTFPRLQHQYERKGRGLKVLRKVHYPR